MRTDGDLCDFSASVSDGLRSVAGFPGSMEARSAACSTAEGGGINNLLLFFACYMLIVYHQWGMFHDTR